MAKVAVVGIVGRTNAGKSTLVNRLVGEKVSIVSPVEQTTRNTVRGIVADPRGQLVLLDTPGPHQAVGRLGTLLTRTARRSASGVGLFVPRSMPAPDQAMLAFTSALSSVRPAATRGIPWLRAWFTLP